MPSTHDLAAADFVYYFDDDAKSYTVWKHRTGRVASGLSEAQLEAMIDEAQRWRDKVDAGPLRVLVARRPR